jgi:hypothetical protein
MAEYNNNSKGTSTHIRTLYSESLSYLTIRFYNTNLSFNFVPFIGKDANGKNKYNETKGITTTINFEGAALLNQAANDVLSTMAPTDTMNVSIECNNGVRIIFERKLDQNNQMSSWLTIEKNGEAIPFKFETKTIQMTKNGQAITKIVETGVSVLQKTIEGYLTGINADRHLNKLTDDFAKAQENKQSGGANNGNGYQNKYQNGGGYNNGGGYQKKPWNNYKKPYNGGGYQNNNNQDVPWNNNAPSAPAQSIGMSSYNVQG